MAKKSKSNSQSASIKSASLLKPRVSYSRTQLLIMILVVAIVGGYFIYRSFADTSSTNTINSAPVAITNTGSSSGYLIATANGQVLAYGTAKYLGSVSTSQLTSPIVSIASVNSNNTDTGYYLLASNGTVYAFGNAVNYGSASTFHASSFVQIMVSPVGSGYLVLDSAGQVFPIGTPASCPSNNYPYVGTFVGMAYATSRGVGCWLVTSTGQVFPEGTFMTGTSGPFPEIAQNTIGVAPDYYDSGFWLATSTGAVHALEGARNNGSKANQDLAAPVIGITRTGNYDGYWLLLANGTVYAFGSAQYEGNPTYAPLPPALSNFTVTIKSGSTSEVNVTGGVANDPNPSTLSIVTAPAHGTARVDTSGNVYYTPVSYYTGKDTLVYQVCSAEDVSICAQASITYSVILTPEPVGGVTTGYSSSSSVGPASGKTTTTPSSSTTPNSSTTIANAPQVSPSFSYAALPQSGSGNCPNGAVDLEVTLSAGSSSDCVQVLQYLLHLYGFYGGTYGSTLNAATCKAVDSFKAYANSYYWENLGSGCDVGTITWDALTTGNTTATAAGTLTVPGASEW